MSSLSAIHRAVFPALELLIGMGIAQILATAQVYVSNHRLFAQILAVADAGFLPVPNQIVLPRLLDLETAFCGGLLFTLSVGAGLALLSAAAAQLWRRFNRGRRTAAAGLAAVLAAAVACLNLRGFDVWVTLYLIAIPPAVFWLAGRSPFARRTPPGLRWAALRFLPLAVLALGWFTQYDRSLFVDLRDHLLLSNTAGQRISAFYYRYTLYPAEVFKTFDQRLIKTVAAPDADWGRRHPAIQRELIRMDYLPVGAAPEADIVLRFEGDRLALLHRGSVVWENTIDRFLADPRRAAAEVSAEADRFGLFRRVTFYGVLLAFPISLYVFLFALLRLAAGLVLNPHRAEAAAAAACLLIGAAVLAGFHLSREDAPPPGAIDAALASDRWQQRVAGLKAIHDRREDVTARPAYARMLHSPYPQERYWLARALGASPNPAAFIDLIGLLDDPQINVRTMALQALAQRRDPRAVNPILKLLKTSDDWYDQLYAYQALRTNLRWDQTRLH